MRKTTGTIGSVSHGTLLTKDLLPAFLEECNRLRFTRDERWILRDIIRHLNQTKDTYFTSGEADIDLNENVMEILDAHSPTGCYFGAHPGDGSDFGWWVSEGYIEEFDGLKVNDTSDVPTGYTGEVIHTNDHGNVTLYQATRGRLRLVWAIF